MGFSCNIVRVCYRYIQAITKEVELAVEEPCWVEADDKALLLQQLIRERVGAIQHALWKRLSDRDESGPPEFGAWLLENKHLREASDDLVSAVFRREPHTARALLTRVDLFLTQGAHEATHVVSQVEVLTGDLSEDLGKALQQAEAENSEGPPVSP